MTWARRCWEAVLHYRIAVVTIVLSIAVVGLFVRVEQQASAIADEARARTTQSCLDARANRITVRAAFFGIFDLFDENAAKAGQPPSTLVGNLRSIIADRLPELTCPIGQGNIVVPLPATSAP